MESAAAAWPYPTRAVTPAASTTITTALGGRPTRELQLERRARAQGRAGSSSTTIARSSSLLSGSRRCDIHSKRRWRRDEPKPRRRACHHPAHQRLTDERQKLLHLHYAEAVPVDLFKQEQERITSRAGHAARQQLADVSLEFDAIEQNLKQGARAGPRLPRRLRGRR